MYMAKMKELESVTRRLKKSDVDAQMRALIVEDALPKSDGAISDGPRSSTISIVERWPSMSSSPRRRNGSFEAWGRYPMAWMSDRHSL